MHLKTPFHTPWFAVLKIIAIRALFHHFGIVFPPQRIFQISKAHSIAGLSHRIIGFQSLVGPKSVPHALCNPNISRKHNFVCSFGF